MTDKEQIQSEEDIKAKRNEEIQRKIKATKEKKKEQDPNYIKHFGVWIDKTKFNLEISKDTYAQIDKRVSNKNIGNIYRRLFPEQAEEIIKANYENEECTMYNDNWCKAHQKDCLLNFTLNMKYFDNIDKNEFNKALNTLLKKNKGFVEVKDLEIYNKVSGWYIMVLDRYKQIYIGQASNDLRGRIVKHWKEKKRFDRLLFGDVKTSILSIDSFGALDTSRIFIKEDWVDWYLLDEKEKKLINSISNKYLLNRTGGGIRDMGQGLAIDILAHKNKRELEK